MNKKIVYVLIGILVLALGAYTVYFFMNTSKNQNPGNDNNGNNVVNNGTKTLEKDGFKFVTKYVGDNTWEYTFSGELPSPCHKMERNMLVKESYPEQVSVNVKLSPPDKDVVCAQVVTPFQTVNTLQASEGATFDMNVEIQSK